MAGKKVKQLSKAFVDQNPVEAIRNTFDSKVVRSVSKTASNEISQDIKAAWEQLFGMTPKSGEMREGEEINFTQMKLAETKKKEEEARKEKKERVDSGFNYRSEILQAERRITREEGREIHVKIQQIVEELRTLTKTSKVLEVEFAEVVAQEAPVNPGKYHLNFFEWMLSIIRSARERVEESNSWLQAVTSKRGKKDYWGLFKKHGTSFGLSGERVVSTQTG